MKHIIFTQILIVLSLLLLPFTAFSFSEISSDVYLDAAQTSSNGETLVAKPGLRVDLQASSFTEHEYLKSLDKDNQKKQRRIYAPLRL